MEEGNNMELKSISSDDQTENPNSKKEKPEKIEKEMREAYSNPFKKK